MLSFSKQPAIVHWRHWTSCNIRIVMLFDRIFKLRPIWLSSHTIEHNLDSCFCNIVEVTANQTVSVRNCEISAARLLMESYHKKSLMRLLTMCHTNSVGRLWGNTNAKRANALDANYHNMRAAICQRWTTQWNCFAHHLKSSAINGYCKFKIYCTVVSMVLSAGQLPSTWWRRRCCIGSEEEEWLPGYLIIEIRSSISSSYPSIIWFEVSMPLPTLTFAIYSFTKTLI